MRHPHYSGRKAETVPSVGSRLAGVVKPSYGKPKLVLESNPLKLTGDPRNFGFNSLGKHDLNARNPRRLSATVIAQIRELAALRRQAIRNHKRNSKLAAKLPRLVKH